MNSSSGKDKLAEEKAALLKKEEEIDDEDYKDPELEPLSKDPEEIKNAENQINEYQPLKDVKLAKLFPWGCFCLKFIQGANNKRSYTEVIEDDIEIDKKLD